MQIHFCTFGNLPTYTRSVITICNEASESGYFNTVTSYNQNTIPSTEREREFMQTNRRGYGYWIWKANVILDMMMKVPEGDIIVYADAGCGISRTPEARVKFTEWISDVVEHPTHRISFQMPHKEETWTKGDIFDLLECNTPEYRETGQHLATIQIYMNNPDNRAFVRKYKEYMAANNYHYVSDAPSRVPNAPSFRDNHHDQSILSLMFKKWGSAKRDDHWNDPKYPIIAIRRRLT